MKYYYTYEIYINDNNSEFNNHYYYGKHSTQDLNDDYYGSGKIIQQYIKKYGKSHLKKTILQFYNSLDELNQAEKELIAIKKQELKNNCLNMLDGGDGGWEYVNNHLLTAEQLHNNAMSGGLGNKKRLQDKDELLKWQEQCKIIHALRSAKEKQDIYNKVSNSLTAYYNTSLGKQEKLQRDIKNQQSNIETAKRWRNEFKQLFNATPESFRKYHKQKEVLQLYKQIKDLDDKEKQQQVQNFLLSLNK